MFKNHCSAGRRALGVAVLAGLGLAAAPAAHAATHGHDSAANDDTSPTMTTHEITDEFANVPLYPIAGSPFDLLSNNVRVPVGGMTLSTLPVTAPFKHGLPLRDVPVVGALLP
jgi:hypothetical protein